MSTRQKDYLSLKANRGSDEIDNLSSSIVREVIIPELEREVNEGEHFARLRQVYHSLILATWFKRNLKANLLGRVYVDQSKVAGVDDVDIHMREAIYAQYLEAFKQGVFNYIKEDYDPSMQQVISKKYFSGGMFGASVNLTETSKGEATTVLNQIKNQSNVVEVELHPKTHESHEALIDEVLKRAFDPNDTGVSQERISDVNDPAVSVVRKFLSNLKGSVEGVDKLDNVLVDVVNGSLQGVNGQNQPQLNRITINEDNLTSVPGHASDRGIHLIFSKGSPLINNVEAQGAVLLHELIAFMGQPHPVSLAFEIAFKEWRKNSGRMDDILDSSEMEEYFRQSLQRDGYGDWSENLRETFETGMEAMVEHFNAHGGARQPDLLTVLSEGETQNNFTRDYADAVKNIQEASIPSTDEFSIVKNRVSVVKKREIEDDERIKKLVTAIVQSRKLSFGITPHSSKGYQVFREAFDRLIDVAVQLGFKVNKEEMAFDVIHQDVPNAFMVPIVKQAFITTELIELASEYAKATSRPLTMDIIAYFLGHELAHYLLGRYEEQSDYQDLRKSDWLGDTLKGMLDRFATHSFNFNQEYQADQLAMRLMDLAGFNVNQAVYGASVLVYLEERSKGVENLNLKKIAILSTHPESRRRVRLLEDMSHDHPWLNSNAPVNLLGEDLFHDVIESSPSEDFREGIISIMDGYQMETLLYFVDSSFPLKERALQSRTAREVEEVLFTYIFDEISFDYEGLEVAFIYPDAAVESLRNRYLDLLSESDAKIKKRLEKLEEETGGKDNDKYYFLHNHTGWKLIKNFLLGLDKKGSDEMNESIMSEWRNVSIEYFKSWGDLSLEERKDLKALVDDPVYREMMKRYDEIAAIGVKLLDGSFEEVEQDIMKWMHFYSLLPTQDGLALLEKILSELKDPRIILKIVRQLPDKNFQFPILNNFIDFSPRDFAFLIVSFLEASFDAMKQNGVFTSYQEELKYLNDLLQEDDENPSIYSPLSLSELILKTLRNQFQKLNKDDFYSWLDAVENMSHLDVPNLFLRTGKDDQPFLVEFLDMARQKGFMGTSFEEDLAIINRIVPERDAGKDVVLLLLIEHYGATEEMLQKASSSFLNTYRMEQYFNSILKTRKSQIQSFSDWTQYWVDFNRAISIDSMNWLINRYALNLEDLRAGIEKIKTMRDAWKKDNRKEVEQLEQILIFLGNRAYELTMKEKQDYSWDEQISLIVSLIPSSKERNNALNQVFFEKGTNWRQFLTIKDDYAVDENAEDFLKSLAERHRQRIGEISVKAAKIRQEYAQSPMGRVRQGEVKPFTLDIGAGELLKDKIDAGEKAFLGAKEEGVFDKKSLKEKIGLLLEIFPEESEARDKHLLGFYQQEEDVSYVDNIQLINLFLSPIERINIGRKAYKQLQDQRASVLDTFEDHLNIILSLFPDYSVERDDFLKKLVNTLSRTEKEVTHVQTYLVLNRPNSAKLSVLFTQMGIESYKDVIAESFPHEKAELLLWLLGLRAKPVFLTAIEEASGYAIDGIKDNMDKMSKTERLVFLRDLLEGANGIFTSSAYEDEQFLLDNLWGMFIRNSSMNEKEGRALKFLYDAIFRFTSSSRKKTLLILRLLDEDLKGATITQIESAFLGTYGLLGPKLAQFLATRTTFLSEERRNQYLKLTDDVEGFDKADIFQTVRLTFDRDPAEIFSEIGEFIAAATFKQVHRSRLVDGKKVVVKILRPGIEQELEIQIPTVKEMIAAVQAQNDLFDIKIPSGMVEELVQAIRDELLFENEVKNQETLKSNVHKRWAVPDNDGFQIYVPEIYYEYTKGRVITEEEVPGVRIDKMETIAGLDVAKVRVKIITEILNQIFVDGFYSTEPHNILTSYDGQITRTGIIDAGSIGRLSEVNRARILEFLGAYVSEDRGVLIRWLMELYQLTPDDLKKPLSQASLNRAVENFLASKQVGRTGRDIMIDIINELDNLGIVIHQEFYTLLKVLSSIDYIVEGVPDKETLLQRMLLNHYMNNISNLRMAAIDRPTEETLNKMIEQLPETLPGENLNDQPVKARVLNEVDVKVVEWVPKGSEVRRTDMPGVIFVLREAFQNKLPKVMRFTENSPAKGYQVDDTNKHLFEVNFDGVWYTLDGVRMTSGVEGVIMKDKNSQSQDINKESLEDGDDYFEEVVLKVKDVLDSYRDNLEVSNEEYQEIIRRIADMVIDKDFVGVRAYLREYPLGTQERGEIVKNLKKVEEVKKEIDHVELGANILKEYSQGFKSSIKEGKISHRSKFMDGFGTQTSMGMFLTAAKTKLDGTQLFSEKEINDLLLNLGYIHEALERYPLRLMADSVPQSAVFDLIAAAPAMIKTLPVLFVDTTSSSQIFKTWLDQFNAEYTFRMSSTDMFDRLSPSGDKAGGLKDKSVILYRKQEIKEAAIEMNSTFKGSVINQEYKESGLEVIVDAFNEDRMRDAFNKMRHSPFAMSIFYGVTPASLKNELETDLVSKDSAEKLPTVRSQYVPVEMLKTTESEKLVAQIDVSVELLVDYLKEIQRVSLDRRSLKKELGSNKASTKRVLGKVSIPQKSSELKAGSNKINPQTRKPAKQRNDPAIKSLTTQENVFAQKNKPKNVGGIDFDLSKMELETQGKSIEFDKFFDPKEIEALNFDGLVPVIIHIVPLTKYSNFLGI